MSESPRETVQAFRLRARAWLADNMPLRSTDFVYYGNWDRARELQRRLYEGGLAGVCFPAEYGGLGLPFEYQQALTEESTPYEMPLALNSPTLGIIAPTLLEFGTEEQKRRFIPRMLSGEEVWVQFLSEPTGGSDLASITTRATLEGDHYVVNGSKVWSSGAHAADWAVCVVRTDWSVPKHDGITVLLLEVHQPGVTVEKIVDCLGRAEFCQEFFDDVRVPVDHVLGRPEEGWTVVRGLLAHERNTEGGGSIYTSGRGVRNARIMSSMVDLATETGRTSDAEVRQLVGEDYALGFVHQATTQRVMHALQTGRLPPTGGALLRLLEGWVHVRRFDMALRVAGPRAAAWHPGDPAGKSGIGFVGRQNAEIGGGTSEMQRNIISERLLSMPREPAADRGVPFDRVHHNVARRREA